MGLIPIALGARYRVFRLSAAATQSLCVPRCFSCGRLSETAPCFKWGDFNVREWYQRDMVYFLPLGNIPLRSKLYPQTDDAKYLRGTGIRRVGELIDLIQQKNNTTVGAEMDTQFHPSCECLATTFGASASGDLRRRIA